MVNAATPNKFLKITSAPNCSDNNPGKPPIIVTKIAMIGVPDDVNLENILGSCFCTDKAHIMRDAA